MARFLYITYVVVLIVISYFLYDAYMFVNYEVPGGCYSSNWRGLMTIDWLSYTIMTLFIILIGLEVYKFFTKKKTEKLHFYIITLMGILIILGVGFIFSKPLASQTRPAVCSNQGKY